MSTCARLRAMSRMVFSAMLIAPFCFAWADYPDRPVKLINPYPAGAGAMDTAARVMAEKMTAWLGSVPVVIFVSASSDIKTLQDLIAAAKARPGQLNYGSPGVATK